MVFRHTSEQGAALIHERRVTRTDREGYYSKLSAPVCRVLESMPYTVDSTKECMTDLR